jgi:hypothetical protein
LGTVLADLAKLLLGSSNSAYAFVFSLEVVGFLAASVLALRIEGLTATEARLGTESANVLRRKRGMPLADVKALCDTLLDNCEVYDLSVRTHQMALALMAKYSLSLFDASIVAAAGLSGWRSPSVMFYAGFCAKNWAKNPCSMCSCISFEPVAPLRSRCTSNVIRLQ